jgi:ribonucleotide reductase alpha subunit
MIASRHTTFFRPSAGPDLFWKLAKDNMDAMWHLMCPHEIRKAMGWSLEDAYGEEWEQRYLACVAEPAIEKREIPVRDLVRMVIKSAVETGTPFAFFRDAVNRANPNGHKGIIHASNLCTEIAQNMSAIESVSQEVVEADGETIIVTKTKAGDFVVCNLASLVLGNLVGGPVRKVGTTVFAGADQASPVKLDASLFTVSAGVGEPATGSSQAGSSQTGDPQAGIPPAGSPHAPVLPKAATAPALFEPLEQVIPALVRALDNVLAMNEYPVPYARITNHQYRPIGIGSSGYHHLLVKRGFNGSRRSTLRLLICSTGGSTASPYRPAVIWRRKRARIRILPVPTGRRARILTSAATTVRNGTRCARRWRKMACATGTSWPSPPPAPPVSSRAPRRRWTR